MGGSAEVVEGAAAVEPGGGVAGLDFDCGVGELQGVFVALLVEAEFGEVGEGLDGGWAPFQGALMRILGFLNGAAMV